MYHINNIATIESLYQPKFVKVLNLDIINKKNRRGIRLLIPSCIKQDLIESPLFYVIKTRTIHWDVDPVFRLASKVTKF